MRKPLFLLIAVHAMSVYAACPETAPGSMSLTAVESCNAYTGCPNGPVTFVIEPDPSNALPEIPYDPGYAIQPCDAVEWTFGDGTTQIITGSERVTHEYPNPGNYTIQATVTNSLGSKSMTRAAVIATSPSQLSFLTKDIKVVFENDESRCTNCVEAREGAATSITVTRGLDLARTVSADALMTIDGALISVPVTFAPGQTGKKFKVTVPDDHVYSGIRYSLLGFANAQGGTLTDANTSWHPRVIIVDDDPIPTLSVPAQIRIAEGLSGRAKILIPFSLSAPMGVEVSPNPSYTSRSAMTGRDYDSSTITRIKTGESSGDVTAWIYGNARPEPDKVFEVRIHPGSPDRDLMLGAKTAVVTIVNDDAAVYPVRTTATIGTAIKLTLDIGSPYAAATTVRFNTSDANVVLAPAPVVIPAGVTTMEVMVKPRGTGFAFVGAIAPDRVTSSAGIVAVGGRRRAASH